MPLRGLVVVLGAVAMIAGCIGERGDAQQSVASSTTRPAQPFDPNPGSESPSNPDGGGPSQDDPDFVVLHRAEELWVEACMAAAGFEYFPVEYRGQSPFSGLRLGVSRDIYSLSEEDAAATELETLRHPQDVDDPDPWQDPNYVYMQSLSMPERARYNDLIDGTDEEWVEVPISLGGGVEGVAGVGTGGCRGGVRERLYGDVHEHVRLSVLTTNADFEAWLRLESSAEFSAAFDGWLSCLADSGLDVRSVSDLANAAFSGDEREVAVLHAECLTESGLRRVATEGHDTALDQVRAEWEGEFIAVAELQQRAVEEAKETLRELAAGEGE